VSRIRTRANPSEQAPEACRQVAELLGFRSVGTVSGSQAPVEDVLEGRVDGLIVFRLDDGDSDGEEDGFSSARGGSPAPMPTKLLERVVIGRKGSAGPALESIRIALVEDGVTAQRILAAVRGAIGADQVLFLRERGGRFGLSASDGAQGPSVLPPQVRSELRGATRGVPLDDETTRRLSALLGMRWRQIAAAFSTDRGAAEVLIVGWNEGEPLASAELGFVARGVAIAHDVLESRDAAVQRLLQRERTRWAGEIHDGLTQAVTGAFLELKTLRGRIARDPQAAAESLDDVMNDVRRTLLEVRGMLFDLTDASETLPGDPIANYVAGVAERWKLTARVSVEDEVELEDLPAPARAGAHLVIREAIANAAKHAETDQIEVRVRVDNDELLVEIVDEGRGFDPEQAVESPGHFGLRLLRERVADAGGTVEIRSELGKGTEIIAHLPIRAATEGDRQ
jgi:signal transduction histidine kinase